MMGNVLDHASPATERNQGILTEVPLSFIPNVSVSTRKHMTFSLQH